jgi:hypothetical protein
MAEKPSLIRTDPPVSEAQRRAMHAAAGGNSTLDIPKKVGKEFSEADPGGKLPARADAVMSKLDSLTHRVDAFEEGDHPRDEGGKFAKAAGEHAAAQGYHGTMYRSSGDHEKRYAHGQASQAHELARMENEYAAKNGEDPFHRGTAERLSRRAWKASKPFGISKNSFKTK